MKLSEAVLQLRLEYEESQEAFARRLGTASQTISRYERGDEPATLVLIKLGKLAREKGREDLYYSFASTGAGPVAVDPARVEAASSGALADSLRSYIGTIQSRLAELQEMGLTPEQKKPFNAALKATIDADRTYRHWPRI